MAKPVAGDIVVLPFPQTNLRAGKRRPALVVVDLAGDDLILCQITSQAHHDSYSISLDKNDFQIGQLATRSFVRPNRLFTAEQSVIPYTAARLRARSSTKPWPSFDNCFHDQASGMSEPKCHCRTR